MMRLATKALRDTVDCIAISLMVVKSRQWDDLSRRNKRGQKIVSVICADARLDRGKPDQNDDDLQVRCPIFRAPIAGSHSRQFEGKNIRTVT